MTTYEILSLIFSVAGSIGLIVSLWLLYRQTSIFNRQLMESLTHSITNYSLEISRLFLIHPDLRPYFFGGKAIAEDHPDYLRAEAVAEVILDIFWTMMSEAKRIRGSEYAVKESREQWGAYVDSCFATSPILASFLTKRKDWYGPELYSRMERGLARTRQQAAGTTG